MGEGPTVARFTAERWVFGGLIVLFLAYAAWVVFSSLPSNLKLQKKTKEDQQVIIDQVNKVLTVSILDRRFVPSDHNNNRYRDEITLTFAFANTGDKDIAGFKGFVKFTDMFGDVIQDVRISYDQGVKARETVTWIVRIDFNEFDTSDVRLRDIDEKKLTFSFIPTTLMFSDGRKLEAPETLGQ